MAISHLLGDSETETPLLPETVDGVVDFKGRPVQRSTSGGWKAAAFIITVEVAERFAYYGINSNLINYLTGPLGQSTVTAAENVNIWSGTASLLPLLASEGQLILFFFSLYLVAFAQGGHKPCVQAFGADQFDTNDPREREARSSFFNWWYFTFSAGLLVTISILNYVQDNMGWVLGFGFPCISMIIALVIFSLGTWTYRFSISREERNPFWRIGRVFIVSLKNWRTSPSAIASQEEDCGTLPSQQFSFLNKALIASDGSKEEGKVCCSVAEVEEAKTVLRLVPIWATSLIYAVVFAQSSTFFTKQGVTLDRKILPGFYVPPASLQSFISLSIVVFIPIYDRIIVPTARTFTGKPSGITMLQRIGTGMFLSAISMVIAAFVEMKRLKMARDHGLIDMPDVTIPMSIWWLIPQYVLFGVADVFTMVGLQEFFYDQVPDELRSVGLALYLSIFGVGSFLSSFLISAIEKGTGKDGHDSWFASNLNRAHLDYFYALLAALSAVELSAFWFFSKSYVYKRRTST
ncbi:Proton-dependent oligopeptide transporter family [Sesbania bispinosa]|nr:Proton-dependent oligopeptide transporter family [Sesbania bispinosa]